MPLSTGMMLKSKRVEAGYKARFLSQVSIFPCSSGRRPKCNQSLLKAMASRTWDKVLSIRLEEHEISDACFCHGTGSCIQETRFDLQAKQPVGPSYAHMNRIWRENGTRLFVVLYVRTGGVHTRRFTNTSCLRQSKRLYPPTQRKPPPKRIAPPLLAPEYFCLQLPPLRT